MEELKARIDKLSAPKKQIFIAQLKALLQKTDNAPPPNSGTQLQAYLLARVEVATSQIKARLKEKLPDYMIPQRFVILPEFPRLPNGKVDLKALKKISPPASSEENNYQAARTAIEAKLVDIWQEVLKLPKIGIQDNFFEIGGDSILSIQIVAKARQMGIKLEANQIFESQSIAELALFAQTITDSDIISERVEGIFELHPIQHWFFDTHRRAPQHWNQALLLRPSPALEMNAIEKAFHFIMEKHDLLRARFNYSEEKGQGMIPADIEESTFRVHQVASPKEGEQILATYQQSLDLNKGALFQGHYFQSEQSFLVLFAHHLVVDMVSWQIILKDLDEAYQLILNQETLPKIQKTSSYPAWTSYLNELAQSEEILAQKDFWQSQLVHPDQQVFPAKAQSDYEFYSFELESPLSEEILKQVPQKYAIKMDEFLLGVFMNAYFKVFEQDQVRLGLEKHGRDLYSDKFDFSETVGWFTSFFPLKLQLDRSVKDAYGLKSIKEQLRQIPQAGLSFGLLRYLSQSIEWSGHCEVIFNYLGQVMSSQLSALGAAEMYFEGARHPQSENYHRLELNVRHQDQRFIFIFSYDPQQINADQINQLARQIEFYSQELKEFCIRGEDAGYSPSDFPDAGLSQDDLDNLMDLL